MSIFLVRHAKAGKRSQWDREDALRPLDDAGRRQALALADRLSEYNPVALVSSPAVRCRETLAPLAERCGLVVVSEPKLYEELPYEIALDYAMGVADRTVLCSHGDVIPAIIDALVRRGMHVEGMRDSRKASVWVLEREGDAFTQGLVWAPPSLS
ncbi:MAG: SixA phosphatase family protein [Actinomycetota bacterium]